jgi:hypothetical protein
MTSPLESSTPSLLGSRIRREGGEGVPRERAEARPHGRPHGHSRPPPPSPFPQLPPRAPANTRPHPSPPPRVARGTRDGERAVCSPASRAAASTARGTREVWEVDSALLPPHRALLAPRLLCTYPRSIGMTILVLLRPAPARSGVPHTITVAAPPLPPHPSPLSPRQSPTRTRALRLRPPFAPSPPPHLPSHAARGQGTGSVRGRRLSLGRPRCDARTTAAVPLSPHQHTASTLVARGQRLLPFNPSILEPVHVDPDVALSQSRPRVCPLSPPLSPPPSPLFPPNPFPSASRARARSCAHAPPPPSATTLPSPYPHPVFTRVPRRALLHLRALPQTSGPSPSTRVDDPRRAGTPHALDADSRTRTRVQLAVCTVKITLPVAAPRRLHRALRNTSHRFPPRLGARDPRQP